MNDYEAKQEARRKRYLAHADRAKHQSKIFHNKASAISNMIPLGQPVLIGHHSEARHRRDIKKLDNAIRNGIIEDDKAAYYQQKAASVGTGGISSDDPEAVVKLKKKITGAEHCQEMMKSANKIIRQKPKNFLTDEKMAELEKLGYTPKQSAKLFEPDFLGRFGFANYSLTNNNANIRRMKKRVQQLASAPKETTKKTYGDITIVENVEENRIQLIFLGKPENNVRQLLKHNGFRWSHYNSAWQRHLNNAGRYAVKQVLEAIKLTE